MNLEKLRGVLAAQANLRISDQYFPGCVIGVVFKNGERLIVPVGKFTYESDAPSVLENSIYDMASVTKSIPTACLLLKLIDEGSIGLDEQIIKYIPELSIQERNNILVRHLLEFTVNYNNPEYSTKKIKYQSADELENFLFTSELKTAPGSAYYYSNAIGILMGLVVERFTGKSLDILAEEIFFQPLSMSRTTFRPELEKEVVPSEIDPWRGREIRGEVHDESAWTLRKEKDMCVGSAGLFSAAPDMLTFLEMLLNDGALYEKRYFSEAMIQQMQTNQLSRIREHHSLGWMMERPWMGTCHSPSAFGRTGFTGTCVFCDPNNETGIVILSNGVYPTRERAVTEGLRDLFRAEIINIILQHFGE